MLLIWIAEACVIFFTALGTCYGMLRNRPFCERCIQWCTGPSIIRTSEFVEPSLLRSKLEAGDFAYVGGLGAGDKKFLEFKLFRCNTCTELNTLTVVSHAITTDKKGKKQDKLNKTIIDKLLVRNEDIARLMGTMAESAAVAPARRPLQSPQSM